MQSVSGGYERFVVVNESYLKNTPRWSIFGGSAMTSYKVDLSRVEKVHIWVLRVGERSIRLNRKYRLIYRELHKEYIVVEVLEVNAHEY